LCSSGAGDLVVVVVVAAEEVSGGLLMVSIHRLGDSPIYHPILWCPFLSLACFLFSGGGGGGGGGK